MLKENKKKASLCYDRLAMTAIIIKNLIIKDLTPIIFYDLIIEIKSPGTPHVDTKRKKDIYKRFGVREYWIVDAMDKKVEVYILKGGGYMLQGIYTDQDSIKCMTIKGLKVKLTEVFD